MTSKLTNDELTETLHLATSGYPLPACVEGNLRQAFAELQERRKADSEPVAWRWRSGPNAWWQLASRGDIDGEVEPLYRHAQPAPEKYNIGDTTMRHIFTPTGMTNVSNMQAVFDRVEAVLVGMEQPAPVVQLVPEEPPEHLLPKGNSRDATYRRGAAIQAWKQCRAAMLQAGNSPVIPDGYVMVPKEPTPEILATITEAIRAMRGSAATYARVLAAAPQEVK